jgi:hypothetical protein
MQLDASDTIDPGLLRLVADACIVLNAIDGADKIPVYQPSLDAAEKRSDGR